MRLSDLDKEWDGNSLVPLDYLSVISLVVTAPGIGVDETTEGISSEISTMRIHLPPCVIGLEVCPGLVDKTNDLDVVWGPHELDALEGASGDKTRAMTGLGAPRDRLMLGLTDGGRAIRRRPNTKI